MGNTKSKKTQNQNEKGFFDAERLKEQKLKKRKKVKNQAVRRAAVMEPPVTPTALTVPPVSSSVPIPAHVRSYDEEALNRMRWQLQNDSDAFILNNILLSVQFFENYEKELQQIKNNPVSERENLIDEAMVRENKHVFFADRIQECVHEHVYYQKVKGEVEPLAPSRLFVIYDNVEASEPGDTSDYSAVLDAPFYKLRIEDCKEPGYVKLKKIEVLESTLHKESEMNNKKKTYLDDSIYTDSGKESNDSDEAPYNTDRSKDEGLISVNKDIQTNPATSTTGRRYSGPIKQVSMQVAKNNISNINILRNKNIALLEEVDVNENNNSSLTTSNDYTNLPRKSILKNARRATGPILNQPQNINFPTVYTDSNMGDDTETSGYRSNSSSRQTEPSETESDYGYSTLTVSATPKKIELSVQNSHSVTSGVLPEEIWTPVEVKALNEWSDDEEDNDDSASKESLSRNLFERFYYLNSAKFMNNFVNNFIISLGSGLGLAQDEVKSALTQGASVYCDATKNGSKIGYEIFPALVASWPNAANQWIIRERRVIQNPRTNYNYQWPTKYMVNKVIGSGCLLVPVGFRPKRGFNPEQTMQWKLIFPAAERYLESCLAHSHTRCYLFTLALHKTFMENETAKIGIDASHIKNHLFWQCEDNYAKWPEDRLGESLRLFLKSLYVHFAHSRLPNYFMVNCNEFKNIPKPLLLKLQKRLANILEAPVMHVLHSLDKLKYTKRDFYPTFNCHRLYDILTCKNPLRILNPNIPYISNYHVSSDSEDDVHTNFWDKAKAQDKHYQWKKERLRQIQDRRKFQMTAKKQKSIKRERKIDENFILPAKMETVRRRLVLEFFIPHFIAMARSSEKFEAIRQAIIYLEQAQRLCILLLDEPGAESNANGYLDVVRDKLSDCQRKLVQQGGYKLPPRLENPERPALKIIRKPRQRFENIMNQDSPIDNQSIPAFTFVDVHAENSNYINGKLNNNMLASQESKL